jgi:Protein phosphatase 2C
LRPEDYATTLSAALLKGDTIVGASLGDSSITAYTVVEGDDRPEFSLIPFCSAPQPENKPKNYTYAITHPEWQSFTAFNITEAPYVKALVLATDGAESFYLDGSYTDDERPFKPEIIAAFDTAVEKLSARGFFLFFSNFLHGYDPDNYDDRTLCIAYRAPEVLAPPTQKPG